MTFNPYTLATLHGPAYLSAGLQGLAGQNLALNRPAGQSSIGFGGSAGKAVDGNTDGYFANGSVAHTGLDDQAWWQVDLGSIKNISDIKIWNRSEYQDRLKSFFVLVSSDPMPSPDLATTKNQTGVTPYFVQGPVGQSVTVGINRPGRYVRIQLSGRDYLQLAEVEVFEADTPAPAPVMSSGSSSGSSSTGTVTDSSPSILDSITNLFSSSPAPAPGPAVVGGVTAPTQTSFFQRSFSVFGYQIPYYVPIVALVGLYVVKKKRR